MSKQDIAQCPRTHQEQVLRDCTVDVKKDLIKESPYGVIGQFEVEELKSNGLTDAQIADALDVLLPAYKAEGLTPTPRLLVSPLQNCLPSLRA